MGAFDRLTDWYKARRCERRRVAICDALDDALKGAPSRPVPGKDRVIIFSDHHKGARDGADDFQRCERGYNAALAYYNRLGYHLIELGDVEELWENSFEEVASNYPRTLELAAEFQRADRYTRFWGNHDLAWSDAELFQEHMTVHGYSAVVPIEALRLLLHDEAGRPVGALFLVHGHQGTADSDRHAKRSRFLVRHGWRRLQRHLNRPWNTPSVDWALRGEHAAHMASWASSRDQVLVAGHTHLPVFFHAQKEPAMTPDQAITPADEPDDSRAEALELGWSEWAEAETVRLGLQKPIPLASPCYFNTGCCSFGDGDITGIEISDGTIRLVRWPCVPKPVPEKLAELRLDEVFPHRPQDRT